MYQPFKKDFDEFLSNRVLMSVVIRSLFHRSRVETAPLGIQFEQYFL